MWAGSWQEVDELERLAHCHRNRMDIAFFNGTGEYFLSILPQGRPMDTNYSAREIVGGLKDAY
jgi:hypothetical protein